MHLLIPFAAPLSRAGRDALHALRLPALDALLRQWGETARDEGDAHTLSPPHERAIGREYGWDGADGRLPWGAHEAERAGVAPGDLAWGILTPVHCHVGAEGVSLLDPHSLNLDEGASRALCDAVRPLFAGDGCALVWHSPLVWLAAHPSLRGQASASLDRVVARAIEPWLPEGEEARASRRLQMELQMLLHDHPVNEDREVHGLPPVNSVWISGCGVHQPARPVELSVDARLRSPALAEDWDAWCAAWRALDAGPIASLRGNSAALTLCGERSALRMEPGVRGLWQRLKTTLQGRTALEVLETL